MASSMEIRPLSSSALMRRGIRLRFLFDSNGENRYPTPGMRRVQAAERMTGLCLMPRGDPIQSGHVLFSLVAVLWRTAMLLLNNEDVAKVLDMRLCLAALDALFQELARGEAVGMGRIDLYVPSGVEAAPYYRWAVMTGGSKRDGLVCARMLSDMVAWPREYGRVRENKYARAPGTFCGLLFLFSARDATPVAMINDGILQHIRVGGGAGLGVKYLARQNSEIVGMIGSGGMARTYLDAFCQVRNIKRVKVYSPNKDNVQRYVQGMSARHGIEVAAAANAREAVRGVDIVSICTSTNEPVFQNSWLEPGMHVTNLTSADVEPSLPRIGDVAIRAGEATPKLARTTAQELDGG